MSPVHQEIPRRGSCALRRFQRRHDDADAQEVARSHVRANGIAPGAIRAPLKRAAWKTKEAYDHLMNLVPYKRIGEPIDIARAAVWLASDESDHVVGSTLFIDGGMTLFPGFATGG